MIRKKDILALEPAPAVRKGASVTAQRLGAVLVLNCYQDRELLGRWCLDTETGRYQAWLGETGEWGEKKLMALYGFDAAICYSRYSWHREAGVSFDTEEDKETVEKALGKQERETDMFRLIGSREEEYRFACKCRAEEKKEARLLRQMKSVPALPPGFGGWLHQVTGGEDYLFMAKGGNKRWICTNCLRVFEAGELEEGGELAEGSSLVCKGCKKQVRCMGKKRVIRRQAHCLLLQDMGGNESVARHMDVRLTWDNAGRRTGLSEAVRIVMYREYKRYACEIYYSQRRRTDWRMFPGLFAPAENFGRTNEANRKAEPGYLYPEGIAGALAGTKYAEWTRVFQAAAEKGLLMDYNLAMRGSGEEALPRTCEYLIKGRFFRLAAESVARISLYHGGYRGPLHICGRGLEEVFGICDRQKINRIRDMDGGELALEWMRFSERGDRKLSQKFLSWAQEAGVWPKDLEAVKPMTPEQSMNYVKRQRAESYPEKTERQTLEQWLDYLDMCRSLGKNLADPMTSRPRELKRRHDEAVEEMNRLRILEGMRENRGWAERMEREMREKYPGAEENLEEVREKFEYASGEYRIIVPRRLSEIALEGSTLHHCGGSSERYYERIMRHETYICFLRRASDPDTPYYTIEVEPGGTIRQHRSFYDLEPGIEELKGFLREWQQAVRKRMKEEDHSRAAASRRLREDNIRQLAEANNTRVLKGLMEDFMSAEEDGETAPEAV